MKTRLEMWKRFGLALQVVVAVAGCDLQQNNGPKAGGKTTMAKPSAVRYITDSEGRLFDVACLRELGRLSADEAEARMGECEVESTGQSARAASPVYRGDYDSSWYWYWDPYYLWLYQPRWCEWLLGWSWGGNCLRYFGYPEVPWYRKPPVECPSYCRCNTQGRDDVYCPAVVCTIEQYEACGLGYRY